MAQDLNSTDGVDWKFPKAIVDCDWLKDQIDNQSIRIFDCTTYLKYTDSHPSKPYDVCSGLAAYEVAHIPKSAYLDLQNDLSDVDSPFSFTLPALPRLAARFNKLGIGDPYHIILYARNGMQWATRVWWMIHVLGYSKISILDGGFEAWKSDGLPISNTTSRFSPADFKVTEKPEIFIGKKQVLAAIDDDKSVLINALTKDIHAGENTRYGRPGHIPKSINIPFHELIDAESGKLISPNDAARIFRDRNITPEFKIVNYCGGGIAATLDAFVLYQLGFENLFIYDNSLSEWAMEPNLPMGTDCLRGNGVSADFMLDKQIHVDTKTRDK